MILVTGAAGIAGCAVVKALVAKGNDVRAFVHRQEHIEKMKSLGASEAFVGDMQNKEDMIEALNGIDAVYHICSAGNPNEVEIGKNLIEAAKYNRGVYVVYHSVLHSILQDMQHHKKKLMVEELLVNSGLDFTIIQPAVFMDNMMPGINSVANGGAFFQKFYVSDKTKMCMIDLEDLAEAVAIILNSRDYVGGTYELCGPQNLTLQDIINDLEKEYKRTIEVKWLEDDVFVEQQKKFGASDYKVSILLAMFEHYNNHGFVGNSKVLTDILKRKPHDFAQFLSKVTKIEK